MPGHSPRRLPLRWFLTVPYLVQVIVIVGLTGWLSYHHGQKTVRKLASDLLPTQLSGPVARGCD